ncbi:serine carboxypeptidase-like 18 [Arachis stenosperma]|uniref:serine carboxypeptidase-like 18 n=1 Tax=Arachis stenosperma TaxID=217475 RepID=UPI0025ABD3B9|nr:serine carboxypeptidase-like 18 [Arachis stenosperma]
MTSLSNFICHGLLVPILLLLTTLFSSTCKCGNIVKYLPGFEGPLPFVLETGYVGVGENDDVQAFNYFIESENNPKVDPLMLYMPRLRYTSPITLKIEEYNGSLPNLILRPHSWTKVSSIIFVDLPVNTGFLYATTESASHRIDWSSVHQTYQFLRKWLIEHPKFLTSEVYIGGDSYSGIPIPVITHEISQGNEGIQPIIIAR